MDFSNVQSLSNVDFSNFSTGLSLASSELDNMSNPVITPVVDDSQVRVGVSNIEDMFNNANISSFAIDAGRSILTSQDTEGDAATSGNVSVNFTQNNYSPEALSPTQIYRDTNNLIRGRIGNMGSYAYNSIVNN